MDVNKVAGSITGVISLVFLLLPACWVLYDIELPRVRSLSAYTSLSAALVAFFYLTFIALTFCLIFITLTKNLLSHSMKFGVLFISSGLLNFVLWVQWASSWEPGPSLDWLIFLNASSIATISVGVSLVISQKF